MKQEQQVFKDIADARTKYAGAGTINEKVTAATELDGTLSRLLVIMENYPQLKSNENAQSLQIEIAGTENRIGVERQRYNDSVKIFNVMTKRFPTNILANMLGFQEAKYFESQFGAENTPKVEF